MAVPTDVRVAGTSAWLSAFLLIAVVSAVACADATNTERPSPTVEQTSVSVQAEFLVSARVERVIDGSTILVSRDGETFEVRYLGVEVPDTSTSAASDQNRHLVEGQTVELEIDVVQADPLGRALRYVYVGGEMVNEVLLATGHAVVSGFPGEFRYRDRLIVAQERARALSRGVWATDFAPTPIVGEPTAASQPFEGGTLPSRPGGEGVALCDFTGTPQPVIKGVVDRGTGERIYYKPGDSAYVGLIIDTAEGDQWLCTEIEALSSGWRRPPG